MQRLLALGALIIATIVHVNTVRADSGVGLSLIDEEVESLGADLVQSTFDRLSALPFDAVSGAADPDALTPAARFGGAAWIDAATDLDDLDGATATVQVLGPDGVGTVDFVLRIDVDYVRKVGTGWQDTGGSRTWFKRATLTATGPEEFAATLDSVYFAEGL